MLPLQEGPRTDAEGISAGPSTPRTILEIPSDAEEDEADEARTISEAPTASTRTLTEGTARPSISEFTARSATLEAEPSPLPAPVSGTARAGPSTARAPTPPHDSSRKDDANVNNARNAAPGREDHAEEEEPVLVKKEEPGYVSDDEVAAWNTPHRGRGRRLDDNDDDDVIEISPLKRRRSEDPDFFEIPPPRPPPFFALGGRGRRQRSRSRSRSRERSLSPLPPPSPLHHPSFPSRPPLRCPNRAAGHVDVVCEAAGGGSRNRGREYFRCGSCRPGGFICWADDVGVRADNPRCDCGYPARRDLTGEASLQPDTPWYKCATDACGFRRFDWDDPLSPEEVNAYFGRQIYPLPDW